MSGVSSLGYTPRTLEEIQAEIEAKQLEIDPGLDLSADQPLGQLNAIASAKQAEVYEAMGALYSLLDPDHTEGIFADHLSSLTGTLRLPAKKSVVACTVNLNASTTLPANSVANVAGQPTNLWRLKTTVVSTTAGNYAAVLESSETGPFVANSGTLTVITLPVTGWNSIANPADAVLGRNVESDASLLVRRKEELAAPGACTPDATYADLFEFMRASGVASPECVVTYNDTLTAGVLPAKSFNARIYDGPSPLDNDKIAQVIWGSKPSGIEVAGVLNGTAKDKAGASHLVAFDRFTDVLLYLNYALQTDENFPATGPADLKAYVVKLATSLIKAGQNVNATRFKAAVFTSGIPGIVDVSAFAISRVYPPSTEANVTIAFSERASLISANIVVTS